MPDIDDEDQPTATLAVAPAPEPEPEPAAEVDEEPAPEEEELPPSTVHVAAAAGSTPESLAAELPEGEEPEPFFIGMWGPKKNYGCPFCYYATIEGSGAVELHILEKVNGGDIKHREYLINQQEGV